MLRVTACDAAQAEALRGLFDRTKEYAELTREIGRPVGRSAQDPAAPLRLVYATYAEGDSR